MARRSSPLIIGLGEEENFLGSDVLAFVEHISHAVGVDQNEVVVVSATSVTVIDPAGNSIEREAYEVSFSPDHVTKNGWPTFMEKEIHEQPDAVDAILTDRINSHGRLVLDEACIPQHVLHFVNKVIMIGCGTIPYTGQVTRYTTKHWYRIPIEAKLSSESRYRSPVIDEKTLVVVISQSGETMGTTQAIRHAREQGAKAAAVINISGSTIPREFNTVILIHTDPEIAIASIKALIVQVTACYILDLCLVQVRGNRYAGEIADYTDKFNAILDAILRVLNSGESVRRFARTMQDATSMIYLGRHVRFPVVLEGTLKLKKTCYIHAEGFATGELKHGPITLVNEGQPVIVTVSTPRHPELHDRVLANIAEVHVHGARMTIIAEEGDSSADELAEVVFRAPTVSALYAPLLTIMSLQIFACELTAVKGLSIDRPRNFAELVTVG